ncbi:hypothetical protein B0H19DRAFT_1168564 [Mycena capillaripes]|nr:hypothetical protein B0H19DRAFT_1168564 [Mycena capillaripes]
MRASVGKCRSLSANVHHYLCATELASPSINLLLHPLVFRYPATTRATLQYFNSAYSCLSPVFPPRPDQPRRPLGPRPINIPMTNPEPRRSLGSLISQPKVTLCPLLRCLRTFLHTLISIPDSYVCQHSFVHTAPAISVRDCCHLGSVLAGPTDDDHSQGFPCLACVRSKYTLRQLL